MDETARRVMRFVIRIGKRRANLKNIRLPIFLKIILVKSNAIFRLDSLPRPFYE